MMQKFFLVAISVLGLATGTVFCVAVAAEEQTAVQSKTMQKDILPQVQNQPHSYTVVKGDTLWSVAKKCYNDPFAWHKLWQFNRLSIINPDIIYPCQVLSLPENSCLKDISAEPNARLSSPVSVHDAVIETATLTVSGKDIALDQQIGRSLKEDEKAQAQPIEQPQESEDQIFNTNTQSSIKEACQAEQVQSTAKPLSCQYIGSESMVVSKDWNIDGAIAGDKDNKLMISAGDTVYVNLGRGRVSAGTKCMVYRKAETVKNPCQRGKNLGFKVWRVGKLEIGDDIGENVSSARVIISYEPIQKGDIVNIISSN